MTNTNQPKENLRPYNTFGLPLLALMGLVALAGVTLAAIVHWVF